MNWEIVPACILPSNNELKNRYNNPNIHLTENGCSFSDKVNNNGKILDVKRINFLKKYLKAVHKAIKNGAKIKVILFGLF